MGEPRRRRRPQCIPGGFLGLDNIGVFDRDTPLPTGGHTEHAGGTGWMAMYCLNLLAIAHAINHLGSDGAGMWNEADGFCTTSFIRMPATST